MALPLLTSTVSCGALRNDIRKLYLMIEFLTDFQQKMLLQFLLLLILLAAAEKVGGQTPEP